MVLITTKIQRYCISRAILMQKEIYIYIKINLLLKHGKLTCYIGLYEIEKCILFT